jgi:hypothetical protein
VQNFVEQIIMALIDGQVDFIVVAGVSAVLHGPPIVTQDLDISYRRSPESLHRFAEALRPFRPRFRGFRPGLPNLFDELSLQQGAKFTLEVENENLDLMAKMPSMSSDQICKSPARSISSSPGL